MTCVKEFMDMVNMRISITRKDMLKEILNRMGFKVNGYSLTYPVSNSRFEGLIKIPTEVVDGCIRLNYNGIKDTEHFFDLLVAARDFSIASGGVNEELVIQLLPSGYYSNEYDFSREVSNHYYKSGYVNSLKEFINSQSEGACPIRSMDYTWLSNYLFLIGLDEDVVAFYKEDLRSTLLYGDAKSGDYTEEVKSKDSHLNISGVIDFILYYVMLGDFGFSRPEADFLEDIYLNLDPSKTIRENSLFDSKG